MLLLSVLLISVLSPLSPKTLGQSMTTPCLVLVCWQSAKSIAHTYGQGLAWVCLLDSMSWQYEKTKLITDYKPFTYYLLIIIKWHWFFINSSSMLPWGGGLVQGRESGKTCWHGRSAKIGANWQHWSNWSFCFLRGALLVHCFAPIHWHLHLWLCRTGSPPPTGCFELSWVYGETIINEWDAFNCLGEMIH